MILFLDSGCIVTSTPFFKFINSIIFLGRRISNVFPACPTFVFACNPQRPFCFAIAVIALDVSSENIVS